MIFTLLLLAPAGPDMKYIRSLYQQAPHDEVKANTLLQLLSENSAANNTLQGYQGAVTIVLAKHTINPYKKYSYFQTGKAKLEKAIANDMNNVELRFLRYSIQTNLPKFLEYNQQINEDKQFLQKQKQTIVDKQLKELVNSYLNQQNNDTSKP